MEAERDVGFAKRGGEHQAVFKRHEIVGYGLPQKRRRSIFFDVFFEREIIVIFLRSVLPEKSPHRVDVRVFAARDDRVT